MYNFLVAYDEFGDCVGLPSLADGAKKVVEEDEELFWGRGVISCRFGIMRLESPGLNKDEIKEIRGCTSHGCMICIAGVKSNSAPASAPSVMKS